jgi:ligand-binding sensor domain-containing protein
MQKKIPNGYTYWVIPFIVFFFHLSFNLDAQDIKFERISNELGLSQNLISAIIQDDQGFLWVGTKDGLNRYDGYQFKVFKNDPTDSTSISDNYIKSLYIDNQSRLWVGTSNGLNIYDPEQETFHNVLAKQNLQSHIRDRACSLGFFLKSIICSTF